MPTPQQADADIGAVIDAVARVVEHALILQNTAKDRLGEMEASANRVNKAVSDLRALESSLDARIADRLVAAVTVPFHRAVNDASDKIYADLGKVCKTPPASQPAP